MWYPSMIACFFTSMVPPLPFSHMLWLDLKVDSTRAGSRIRSIVDWLSKRITFLRSSLIPMPWACLKGWQFVDQIWLPSVSRSFEWTGIHPQTESVNPLLLIQSQTSWSLAHLSSEAGWRLSSSSWCHCKLLDALHNAGAIIIIGDCRFCAAWWWVSLLSTIEVCFILPIFLIKAYSTLAFAASATSTTLLSK